MRTYYKTILFLPEQPTCTKELLKRANAGISQTVKMKILPVVIVGATSDPDPNDILDYLWRQIAGPTVVLSNSNSANPAFTGSNCNQMILN